MLIPPGAHPSRTEHFCFFSANQKGGLSRAKRPEGILVLVSRVLVRRVACR